MENLPNDTTSLPSRVFYSPSEDKLYFGEVGDYKEVPRPQSFDDVLGVNNETDKEARFIDDNKYTIVKLEGMAVADEDVGSITQINSDSIELQKKSGSGKATIVSYEEAVNTEHTLQAKSGTIAHVGDFFPDIHFVDNSDDNTNLTTTSNLVILTSTNTSVTIIKLPPLTDGLIIYATNKGSADLKLVSIDSTNDFWESGVASPGIDVVAGTTLKLVCDGVHYIAF